MIKKSLSFISFMLAVSFFFTPLAYCLELESTAFKDNEAIPNKYSGRGADLSPELIWKDVPNGTESFALIMDDPDAPLGTWIHWVIFNIPKDKDKLSENIERTAVLSDGTMQGINSFRWIGYGGPYPPKGSKHRYIFRLFALNDILSLKPGASKGQLLSAMKGHILGEARLIGTFEN